MADIRARTKEQRREENQRMLARRKERMLADPEFAEKDRARRRANNRKRKKRPEVLEYYRKLQERARRAKGMLSMRPRYVLCRDPALRAERREQFERERPCMASLMERAMRLMPAAQRARDGLDICGTVMIAVADGAIPIEFTAYDIEAARRHALWQTLNYEARLEE